LLFLLSSPKGISWCCCSVFAVAFALVFLVVIPEGNLLVLVLLLFLLSFPKGICF